MRWDNGGRRAVCRFLRRCLLTGKNPLGHTKRFGIVQGGIHVDLRRQHMAEICALPV